MQEDNKVSVVTHLDKVQPSATVPLTIARRSGDEMRAPTLDQSRIDDIRGKILSGAYHSLATAEQIARHILRSGDLAFRSGI
jgi:hypothetical protein